jgi:cysteine desulfurase
MIYFDHAATTPLLDEVHNLICESLKEDFANPSSKHKLGSLTAKKIEAARKNMLKLLEANSYEMIFTSSATESNNQVIKTFSSKSKVIYCLSDHPSISKCVEETGDYILESDNLLERVNDETQLVVISLVNSQAGHIKNVEEITKAIKEKNSKTKVLVDAVQGVGKIPFSLKNSAIDYVSIAAHKIGGPRGIAALLYKKGIQLDNLLEGGGHENSKRSSTPATSLILGFELALKISVEKLEENLERVRLLNSKLTSAMEELHKNIEFPFKEVETSPYILCLLFKGVPSDVLLRHLEMKEIYISSTTACSSKIKGKNPMFVGLGIDEKFHKNVMRVSISSSTTDEEVEEFIEKFKQVIEEISFLIK